MKRLGVMLLVLALAMPALAQDDQAATDQTLSELRAEAMRLTALAAIPEAGRAEAEALLQRLDTLSEATRSLEMARLRAYIAALQAGDTPAVAREVAAAAISDDSVALARDREALRTDVAAFVETYPEAAQVLRRSARAAVLGRVLAGEGRSLGVASQSGRFERLGGQRDGRSGERRGPRHDTAPSQPTAPSQESGSGT